MSTSVKHVKLHRALLAIAAEAAKQQSVSLSSLVARAIKRDLAGMPPPSPSFASPGDYGVIIPISEVARRLCLSVATVRRRARTEGDPIRAARSRLGKQRPMHFRADKIEGMERVGYADTGEAA